MQILNEFQAFFGSKEFGGVKCQGLRGELNLEGLVRKKAEKRNKLER